jgi:hypothetical protein
VTNVNRVGGGGRWRNGYWTQRIVLLLGEESKMKMDRKYVVRRRVVAAVVFALVISLFTYATRDVCYVGKDGNWLGYGSCLEMIDKVTGEANK